jgi:hypothetical protein
MAADRSTVLCIASHYNGDRFLVRSKQEGCRVLLLTLEKNLNEPWPRQAIDEVFALPHFQDRRLTVNAVSYLARTRSIRRVIALNDDDVEIAAHLREHLRLPGLGESAARLFRDRLAMRTRARELGVRIPDFVGVINHDEVRHFLTTVPGPWLLKPRGRKVYSSLAAAVSGGYPLFSQADDVWRAIEKLGDEQSFHLVERQLAGELYQVDSLAAGGRVVFTEVNVQLRPQPVGSSGVYVAATAPRDRPDVAALREINARLLGGFGLARGAAHTEFMRTHADGEFYLLGTSARVGGANTAELVEAATGLNPWSEWAWLEAHPEERYDPPPLVSRYAGVVISPSRQEQPDTAEFTDPEIVYRLDKKHHVGFVLAADAPGRVEQLLAGYAARISRDYAR